MRKTLPSIVALLASVLLLFSCDPFDPAGKTQYEIDLHYAETVAHTTERNTAREWFDNPTCRHGRIQSFVAYSEYCQDDNGVYWRSLGIDVYDGDIIHYNREILDHGASFTIYQCQDCGCYYKVYGGADNSHLWWLDPATYQ